MANNRYSILIDITKNASKNTVYLFYKIDRAFSEINNIVDTHISTKDSPLFNTELRIKHMRKELDSITSFLKETVESVNILLEFCKDFRITQCREDNGLDELYYHISSYIEYCYEYKRKIVHDTLETAYYISYDKIDSCTDINDELKQELRHNLYITHAIGREFLNNILRPISIISFQYID